MTLTSKQRAQLRGMAAGEDTIVIIGKGGITDNTVSEMANALKARELVKGRVLETSMPGDYSLTYRGGSYVGVKVDEWLNAVNEYLNPMKAAIEKENCQIVYETGSGQFAVTDGSELWASK